MIYRILTLFFMIGLNSCNGSKNLTSAFIEKSIKAEEKISVMNCPNNGKCEIIIKENSKIVVKKEFEKEYPVIETGNNTVYQVTFYKSVNENYEDSTDKETIIFELNNNTNKKLMNNELKQINAFFGKFCYCKDIAGYYKILNGSFKIEDGKLSFKYIKLDKLKDRQLLKQFSIEY